MFSFAHTMIDYKQYYENLALGQQQEGEETFDTVDENGHPKRALDDAEDSDRFVTLDVLLGFCLTSY